jgi:hypothetical protein
LGTQQIHVTLAGNIETVTIAALQACALLLHGQTVQWAAQSGVWQKAHFI